METNLREHRHCSPPNALPESSGTLAGKAGGVSTRILIVDDNSDDRLIVTREVCRELPHAIITEVQKGADLDEVLASELPMDLLITDYQLFWSDGISVIRRAREVWPDIPVIMYTGTGNEEIAVEAMKAGVHDYVTKSTRNYQRLVNSVVTALQSGIVKRHALAAERRYTTLFDTVPVGLFRSTPHGELLDVNPALAHILGYQRDELVGRNFSDLHPAPSDFTAWRDPLEREGAVAWEKSRFKTADGQVRWVEIHAKALRDPVTHEVIYEGSIEDITLSTETEAERDQLINRLQAALSKVQTLSGLLPICSSCKKIRDDRGRWNMLESYIENHSSAHFTHSFCPECARRLYPEVFLDTPKI